MLEQSVPEGLCPMVGADHETVQSSGKTHVGKVHVDLHTMGRTPR